ncbi:TonB-dependent receptor family protein [Lysobacter sp. A3-1-A15]|uniref:TonB-dependent receptor family protein n=1 Tax=Novilysobacter viscosus TaxID=3098602 RepID=UPI002ED91C40
MTQSVRPIPRPRPSLWSACLLLCLPGLAHAQQPATEPETLDRVQVIGASRPLARFPGSVDVVDGAALRQGQAQVNLSEALSRVPGVTVRNRGNYAQDLQVQSRGFGARSTFGIRGLELVVDGIPASAVDGQGQAANFALSSLDRIEVLRGPLALQYGNAAGGAIVGYTEPSATPSGEASGWLGDHDGRRVGVRADLPAADGRWRSRWHASRFATGGERPHSRAERLHAGAVAQWQATPTGRLKIVADLLAQPWTQDPLGLSRTAWERDPHGTDPVALRFNTRKRIDNRQAGLQWDQQDDRRAWWVHGHGIARDIEQFLSIPPGAQAAPTSAGGVIDLSRRSAGIDAGHRWLGARAALSLGVSLARLDEARRGYENFVGERLGVRGALRRNEDNRVDSGDVHAVVDVAVSDAWTVLAGARHSRLAFESRDRYVAAGNGDDSGSLEFSETAGSVGVARAFVQGEVFASLGRGFETPTVNELAYRPDGGAGFNRLDAARFDSGELGVRWRWDAVRLGATVYRIEGHGEIVPADSRAGRSSFANAGRTRRNGLELSLSGPLAEGWSFAVAANVLDATFRDGYSYGASSAGRPESRIVRAGNRVPGIPRADGFVELAWRDVSDRWGAALEVRASGPVPVDDRNADAAPGHARLDLRLEWRPLARGWFGFARVDNLLDRDHVGSVIVNDGNGRFFEPGPGRGVMVGLGWRAAAE